MPNVSRAQTVNWKFHPPWPTRDIFHEFANDFAKRVNDIGGQCRLRGARRRRGGPAFQMQDAVNAGILDGGGHGVCAYWYGKNKAFSLFGTPPAFGWDANNFLAWMNYGGGYELYNEGSRQLAPQPRRLPDRADALPAARLVQEPGELARPVSAA